MNTWSLKRLFKIADVKFATTWTSLFVSSSQVLVQLIINYQYSPSKNTINV